MLNKNKIETILFVDDDINLLYALKRKFRKEPFKFLLTDKGKKALEILEKEQVSVIVSDYLMPEMDGLQLMEIIFDKYPETLRILSSGIAEIGILEEHVRSGTINAFILKPWDLNMEFLPFLESIRNKEENKGSIQSSQSITEQKSNHSPTEIDSEMQDLINGYIKDKKEELNDLNKYLFENNFIKIYRIGHSIKGSGLSFGFNEITDFGLKLEISAKQKNANDLKRIISEYSIFLSKV